MNEILRLLLIFDARCDHDSFGFILNCLPVFVIVSFIMVMHFDLFLIIINLIILNPVNSTISLYILLSHSSLFLFVILLHRLLPIILIILILNRPLTPP